MEQQEKWQAAIDRDFPHGAIASWTGRDTTYNVALIQVTGMQGLYPILKLYIYGADRVLEDMVVTDWQTVTESPLIIQAAFANEADKMRFVADVPEQLATLMDLARPVLVRDNPVPQ